MGERTGYVPCVLRNLLPSNRAAGMSSAMGIVHRLLSRVAWGEPMAAGVRYTSLLSRTHRPSDGLRLAPGSR